MLRGEHHPRREVLEGDLTLLHPPRVGVLRRQLRLYLGVLDDATLGGVHEEHPPWCKTSLPHDLLRVDVEHTDLGGQHHQSVVCHPEASWTKAVAIEDAAGERSVREDHCRRPVPRLHERCVVTVKGPTSGVHGAVVLPCLGDHHQHRVRQGSPAEVKQLQRFVEAHLPFAHEQPAALERQECRMAFVHVEHGRLQAQRLQRAQSADAQHDLLPQAHVRIAAIELVRDVAVLGKRRVLRNVGVQQQQAHASHIQPPHLDVHRAPRRMHLDADLRSRRVARRLHRPVVKIVYGITLRLPPVGAQVLLEISGLIQQTDSHQVQPRVAGRFQVIARQDAQATRIDRERLDQTVLHRKVRHQHRLPARALGLLRHVFVERPTRLAVHRQVHPVRGRLVQRRLRQPAQHRHRIVTARPPQVRVEPAEHCANRVIPRPQQVHAQLA